MEKINNIFLNYRTYNAFQRDLSADKISPTSIAFIQDNLRIWAHGKEYACNNLTIQNDGEGSISFVDSLGNTLLSLSADPNGYINVSGVTGDAYEVFVSRGDFANYVGVVEQLKQDFEKYKAIVTGDLDRYVIKDELLDSVVEGSNNPVKSKAIHQALEGKQDVLVPGEGIEIQGNTISSYSSRMITLTTARYNALVEQELIDPNTYYFTYDGEEESDTWHFGESFPIILTEGNNWAFGGTFPITLT